MSGWASIYNNTRAMLRYQGEQIARLQEMAATGSRVNRPSDAPADAFRILQYRAEDNAMEVYGRNLGDVIDSHEVAAGVFQNLSDTVARVRTLTAQAASGTYSTRDRLPIASEIDSLLEQAVALANTSQRGQRLFGGGNTDQSTYQIERRDGKIVGVTYTGGDESLQVPVAEGVEFGAVLVGDAVFRSRDRQDPAFLGNTGAKPGAGTSSATGDVWLTATHTATLYEAGSGVAAGDSSAAGDTLLGSHHTLTVDEVNRTVRLDDGAAVAFTGTETDLKLTNHDGDVAYVDVRNVAPGFQGSVAIDAQGTLSIDDGAATVAIDGGTAQAVTDSRTGRILYVNTAEIARAGLEPVHVPGTYDLFGALIGIRDTILNARGLPADDQTAMIEKSMDSLAEVSDGLTAAMTSNGSLLQAMTGLKDSMANRRSVIQGQAGAVENADIVDVASELARRQVIYEMALTSASKLLTLSLLKYI